MVLVFVICFSLSMCMCGAKLFFYSHLRPQIFRKLFRGLFSVMKAAYILTLAHGISGGYHPIVNFHLV